MHSLTSPLQLARLALIDAAHGMLHVMFASFMDLPPEVRLEVYAFYVLYARCLTNRRQPSNRHFRLFRVCKQIAAEAESTVFTYVSLLHEHQIRAFIANVPDKLASRITYADVANDGRVITSRVQGALGKRLLI
jgi:hypothetical protein